MKHKILTVLLSCIFVSTAIANPYYPSSKNQHPKRPRIAHRLTRQPGYFRFSFEDAKSSSGGQSIGLAGIQYLADVNQLFYGGMGAYGAVTGGQGGLLSLGVIGGIHYEFYPRWLADANIYFGGGGGRSSSVGGGLMFKPQLGIEYDWDCFRLGLYYSYLNFSLAKAHSSQVGVNLDFPLDFYYIPGNYSGIDILGGELAVNQNDLGLFLQAYLQQHRNHGANGNSGNASLIGAELDHYMMPNLFWYIKTAGAFHGIPNGYMDVLGGFGCKFPIDNNWFTLVPQIGIGAGGGGGVDTGGGLLLNPQLGIEFPLLPLFSARLTAGYVLAPQGSFNTTTVTAMLLYHLDMATACPSYNYNPFQCFYLQKWQLNIFNQTYLQPQRVAHGSTSPINLVTAQLDQFFNPYMFFSYQAASAYTGAGGYASGMLGLGLQSDYMFNGPFKFFGEVLAGAGGGGGLALGSGALFEPVAGVRYYLNPCFSLMASVGQVMAINSGLNTTALNLGFTYHFGTANADQRPTC